MRGTWKGSALKVLALGVLLGVGVPARGSAQEKRLEITGFMGGVSLSHDLGSVSNIYFTTTGEAANVDFGKYLGLRAALFFSPYIGIEGNLSQASNSFLFTVVNDVEAGTVDIGDQFDATRLSYGGSFIVQYPLENGLAPYGLVGFGWQRTEPDSPIHGIDTVSSTDFSVGGGLKYFFAGLPWLGANFDLRYHFVSDGLAFLDNSASPRSTDFSFGVVLRPF